VLAGNDLDEAAAEVFKATHSEAKFLHGPIERLTAPQFLKAAGSAKGKPNCLTGGPPCQEFSMYNHQRDMHDKRSHLFRDYLHIINGLLPSWIILENVTGIISTRGGEAVAAILECLQTSGYMVEYRILKAEEYGVPQERQRVIFLSNRVGSPIIWPEVTHREGKLAFVTIGDAISDLPKLSNGEDHRTEAESEYQRIMREGSNRTFNHAAPRLAQINLKG